MNFTKPTDTTPSLLTFSEFETFLHEFGHALHAILSEGEHESISGTHVYQDFVELPSQIMENWATEKEFLDLWAVNYKTGEPIPADLIAKIVAAENYQAAYFNVRQLLYGLNDMAWHSIDKPFEGDVELFERTAMAPAQVLPVVEGAAMSPAFSHILPADMLRAITVTSGPRCWRPMPSRCSRRRVFSIPKWRRLSAAKFSRRAVTNIR